MARTKKRSAIAELVLDLKDKVTGKVPQVTASTEEIDAAYAKSAESITRSGEKAETGTEGFVAGLGKLKLAALGAVAAVATLATRISAWTAAAAIQLRAETKLETILRRTTGATSDQVQVLKEQAAALQQLSGYGDEATISAQAMLATFGLTVEEIAKLTPALLDTAEGVRKMGDESVDLEQVAVAIGKAYTDGASALKRYGVSLTEAQAGQLETATGMERTALLVEVLEANFGGLAEAVGATYEGSVRKADAASGDFSETLGRLFTDNAAYVRVVSEWGRMWDGFSRLVKDNAGAIGAAVTVLANTVTAAMASVRGAFNTVQIGLKAAVSVTASIIGVILDSFGSFVEFFDKDFAAKIFNASESVKNRVAAMRESMTGDFEDLAGAGKSLGVSLGLVEEKSEKAADGLEKTAAAARSAGEEIAAATEGDPFAALSEGARKLGADIDALTAKDKSLAEAIQSAVTGAITQGTAGIAALSEAIVGLIARSDDAAASLQTGLVAALKDLTGSELLDFQRQAATAFEEIAASADAAALVMEGTLAAAFQKLGLDMAEIAEGISGEESALIDAFRTVAENGQATAEQIAAAFDGALARITNPAALTDLGLAMHDAFDRGLISVTALNTGLAELEGHLAKAARAADPVEQAFEALGIVSSRTLRAAADEALRSFEIIRDSGTATPEDIAAAWEVYAEKAIASGDAVAESAARESAYALGLVDTYNALIAAKSAGASAGARSADAAEREADALERGATAQQAKDEADDGGFTRVAQGPSFEEIYATYGRDVSSAFPRVPGASGLALYTESLVREQAKAYREWLDENHPLEDPVARAQSAPLLDPAAQPTERIEISIRGADGRVGRAFTDREGADLLRQAARERDVALA